MAKIKRKIYILIYFVITLTIVTTGYQTKQVSFNKINYSNNHSALLTMHANTIDLHIPESSFNKIKIGIIDTGFIPTIPFLNITWANSDFTPALSHHGIIVASLIGAKKNNYSMGFQGVLPGVHIVAFNIPSNHFNSLELAHGINQLTNQHVDIINVSLSTSVSTPELYKSIVRAIKHGIVIIASSGNTYNNIYNYPASYPLPGLISVGALDKNLNILSSTTVNRRVDVYAPGQAIHSINYNNTSHKYQQEIFSGTSVSTPYVTVLAALLKAKNPKLSPQEIAFVIQQTALSYESEWWGQNEQIKLIDFRKTLNYRNEGN
ncbi:S8 family serine peptidase [Fodinisporobacter ferrooxydans]|uniref:S8 family serine peptidase n=1 Tax=Fodinisporobacter ferrooxydans TaxID=2901836 RepID=A0ABY4CXD8_9BACL|nr:S8 family serine peptidase [Alicyclobacillaceae bacterium MYW30-H2]